MCVRGIYFASVFTIFNMSFIYFFCIIRILLECFHISVNCFSGCLLTYLVMKELKRNNGRLKWGMFYFHRFWRQVGKFNSNAVYYKIQLAGNFLCQHFMEKKLKQGWSTIQTILTKRTTTSLLKPLPAKQKKTQTTPYVVGYPGHGLNVSIATIHAMCCYQTCMDGITFVYLNGVDIPLRYHLCISDLY